MRRTTITCDHCGKELDEMHDYVDNEVEILNWFKTDLCKKCAEELDSYVSIFCGKKEKLHGTIY